MVLNYNDNHDWEIIAGKIIGFNNTLEISANTVLNGNIYGNDASFNRVDIDGGSIDNTIIGANTAAAGSFTNLDVSQNLKVTGKINGIQNVYTENLNGSLYGSITTFISGNPDSSTIIGGQIQTRDGGDTTQKEFILSCGDGTRKRSIVIAENQPVIINNDLAVYNELSCAELQVDNLIKLGVDSGNAGEVLTSNGLNNPTWSAIPPITAIDNIIIGANTPAEGSFTNLNVSGTLNGTLSTASQQNITSVGTLTGLDILNGDSTQTHFNHGNNNLNYIRGDTDVDGVLTANSTIIQQERVLNTFSYFGNCVLGNVRQQNVASLPEAGFCHRDFIGWDKFALMQNHAGNTHVNGVSSITFRLGWSTYMSIQPYITYSYNHLYPGWNNARDLGSTALRWRTVYAINNFNTSDDRLKINERAIPDALKLISTLNYYEYERVATLDGKDVTGTDRGVIAQQLLNTDISYAVQGGGTEEIDGLDDIGNVTKKMVEVPYCVNYNVLLATSMQATKELDQIVSKQASAISSLEARTLSQDSTITDLSNNVNLLQQENANMKTALNDLLSAAGKSTM